MPMRGELPAVAARTFEREPPSGVLWSFALTVALDFELQALAAFALIGLLLTINAMLLFPDFGQTFAELAIFP